MNLILGTMQPFFWVLFILVMTKILFLLLGIPFPLGKAPRAITLFSWPPPLGWMKANSYGLSKGNPRAAACGALFRNSSSNYLGGFDLSLKNNTTYFAELMVVVELKPKNV